MHLVTGLAFLFLAAAPCIAQSPDLTLARDKNWLVIRGAHLPKGEIRTGPDGVRRAANPANTRKGGGIFLHVSNGKPTAGCIAIPQAQMAKVMRWLDPAKQPIVVVARP